MIGCLLFVLATDVPSPPPSPSAPLEVPFIAQVPGYCGPAALAMVAQYYGLRDVTPERLATNIYLSNINGVLTLDLVAAARQLDPLWAREYRGDWNDLRQKTRAGLPLIVLGYFGQQPHYFVVLSAEDDVIVHTDSRPKHRWSREDFLRWWQRSGYWTLLVCPPNRGGWKPSRAELIDLGLWHEQRDQWEAAEKHYRQADAPLHLGNVYLRQGRWADAAAQFARLPNDPDALNNLAWTYHEWNTNLTEAVRLCQRALELQPQRRAYYLDTLAALWIKLGNPTGAVAALNEAL
ncbi:MAG: cysteine peptidase family C39 domain-containing protein, partial [Verrucomicrobiae bacterium]|nr:cysteine peptidase family C39 domain-containing protein [Verrucomicrobiae bacterium]